MVCSIAEAAAATISLNPPTMMTTIQEGAKNHQTPAGTVSSPPNLVAKGADELQPTT